MKRANYFHVAKLLALVFVFPIVLCGCSDKRENTDNKQTPAEETQVTEAQFGGSITVGITQDLDSLDPHKAVAAGTKEVLFNLYEGLVKPDTDGNMIPAVAETIDISQDGTRYTFTLRDGVTFHNGNPVTAEDAIYSIKRSAGLLDTVDPAVSVEDALSLNVKEVNKLSDQQIEVVLDHFDPDIMAYFSFAVVPADVDNLNANPVGTGPFEFVSYEPLEKIVIKKYENYYGEPAYLDQVTFKIFSSTEAASLELSAGTIDIFPYLTDTQAMELSNTYSIKYGTSNVIQGLFLNNQKAPFNDIRVRQAVNHAIDKQEILEFIAGGHGSIIGTSMYAAFTDYYDEALNDVYPYDQNKAQELLKEAGYTDDLEFTILVPSNYDIHVQTAQVVVEQLSRVGIKANIKLIEWESWLSDVYGNRNYEASICGLTVDLTPRNAIERYQSDFRRNFVNYNNSEFDRIYKLAISTADESQTIDYYKQLQGLLTHDAASVYIQNIAQMTAINKKLDGYTYYPIYVQDMAKVYYIK